jgi:hypothetical protein
MLLSRPSSTTCMNTFGKLWTTNKSLGSSGTSSRDQTPRFHTPRSVQGIYVKLYGHKKVATMFQHATKYNVQMIIIFLILFDLEIKNEQIIEEKDGYVQNLQGALEKEQKFKVKL